jgi:hypothetical protein
LLDIDRRRNIHALDHVADVLAGHASALARLRARILQYQQRS